MKLVSESCYHELHTKEFVYLFSYETLVALYYRESKTVFYTDKKWSQTTSRHLAEFKVRFGSTFEPKSQSFFDSLNGAN